MIEQSPIEPSQGDQTKGRLCVRAAWKTRGNPFIGNRSKRSTEEVLDRSVEVETEHDGIIKIELVCREPGCRAGCLVVGDKRSRTVELEPLEVDGTNRSLDDCILGKSVG